MERAVCVQLVDQTEHSDYYSASFKVSTEKNFSTCYFSKSYGRSVSHLRLENEIALHWSSSFNC